MTALLALTAAYVLGAVPTGYLVGRAVGLGDIRRHGSGNIGAANVLRTLGRGPALLTLGGDVLKGALAVLTGGVLAGDPRVTAACATLAVVGNCWSVFLRFRGGKGMATGFGAMLALVPWAALPSALVWVAVAVGFRYASLASITAAMTVPLGTLVLYRPANAVATMAIAAVIVVRHRDNIRRLLSGTEPRIGQRSPA